MDEIIIYVKPMLISGVIAVSAIAVAYVLIAFYLPRLIMRPVPCGRRMQDRGIKKYTYDSGRAVVYMPEIPARKYIKQYIICSENGAKYLRCYVNNRVRYIEYDVHVFNNKNKLIDIIGVNELLGGGDISGAVKLPADTSYVSLILRNADGMYWNRERRAHYSYVSCAIYGGVSALLIAIVGMLTNSFVRAFCHTSDIVFPTDFAAFLISLIVGLVLGGVIVLLYTKRYGRGIN